VASSSQSRDAYKNSVSACLLVIDRLDEAQEISVAYEAVREIHGLP